jgi:hypothetical protein
MKKLVYAAVLALAAMIMTAPWLTSAHPAGPSANGSYTFVAEDNLTKTIEFYANGDERGTTTGRFNFTDEAGAVEGDPDNMGEPPERPTPFSMTADLDSLTIENNRALMGGIVRDSSHRSYIGKWVQLVVEDNFGTESPDKVSWRLCEPEPSGWTPSDAEDPRDEGASLQWWATDAEREDDKGVQSTSVMPGIRKGCPVFPLAAYRFPYNKGEGQIQVQQ